MAALGAPARRSAPLARRGAPAPPRSLPRSRPRSAGSRRTRRSRAPPVAALPPSPTAADADAAAAASDAVSTLVSPVVSPLVSLSDRVRHSPAADALRAIAERLSSLSDDPAAAAAAAARALSAAADDAAAAAAPSAASSAAPKPGAQMSARTKRTFGSAST